MGGVVQREIVASGDTLAEVHARVQSEGIKGVSYQKIPGLIRSV